MTGHETSGAATTSSGASRTAGCGARSPWLFSRNVDLAAFLGPAVAACGLVLLGARCGWLERDAPEWTWIGGVLLVDVAHVWATAFVVYFDPAELRRRPWLYALVPGLAWGIGWAVHSESPAAFWRVLAYLAVFHFVRQQVGWVALYRARCGERDAFGRRLDTAAVMLATVYPLTWWHAHLPRRFRWFVEGDFAAVPEIAARCLEPVFWIVLAAYFGRSVLRGVRDGFFNPGKDLVVGTTAACWYVGIVLLDSDFAFTATNVLIHGVPYLVLVQHVRRVPAVAHEVDAGTEQGTTSAAAGSSEPGAAKKSRSVRRIGSTWWVLLASVWALAYFEELLWDRAVWHERAWLFGPAWETDGARDAVVALLAVPQVAHYVLDGFVWRRRSNPRVSAWLGRG